MRITRQVNKTISKFKYVILVSIISVNIVNAQRIEKMVTNDLTEPVETNKMNASEPYMVVEKMPMFPGGEKALMSFISSKIKYPVIAQENGSQGKVLVRFVVNENGFVEHAEVLRSVEPSLDKEALRVVNLLPDWMPGEHNGKKVPVYYTLPITFKMESGLVKKSLFDIKNALIIIDDKLAAPDFNLSSIQPINIESISILKPDSGKVQGLVEKYGEGARKGVMVIKTKKDGSALYNQSNLNTNLNQANSALNLKDTILSIPKNATSTYTVVEKMPQYPGGNNKMWNDIGRNIKYPVIAQENKIQGKVVLRFIVSKTGKVSNIQVLRSLYPACDNEAVRVVQMLDDWIPGEQNGVKVPVYYTLPISFKLQ
jgi:TonB family protein